MLDQLLRTFAATSKAGFALALMLAPAFTCATEPDSFSTIIRPAIDRHCAKCHGAQEDIEGDVDLTQVSADSLARNIELLHGLIDVLDLEEMPPEEEPAIDPARRSKLVNELKSMLHATVAKKAKFSHAPVRRMNRFQYNNAVIDLFDLQCIVFTLPERMMREHNDYFDPASEMMGDEVTVGSRPLGKSQLIERRLGGVAAFPQDLRAEHGFDNRGDHLSLSPLLMESFLKLGQSITQSSDFTPENVGVWKTFFERPTDATDLNAVVRRRLAPFLTKAFRRPVNNETLDRYVTYVVEQLDTGTEFSAAMKSIAAATIASPRFLYLYDRSGQTDAAEPIDDFELASRLSFFLWGSIPDTELIDLARSGTLRSPGVLDGQLNRMMKDRRLKRFCDSFPSQWLQLERIVSSVPDPDRFPGFYFAKFRDSMHMMMEPLLLFETVLIENRPITELIDPEFTYRSPLLEGAYGELSSELDPAQKRGGGVMALKFHRVPVADRRSGGVITNAAVMTMTSGPERTQPITRGAWIATVIFNNPPEPPPADVPPLGEKPAEGEEHLTLRERLALHRKRSDCKGCHEQIDPLGFALENYNPIGVWRKEYENGRKVEVSGTLFRKHEFADVVEFKDAILAEKDRFTRAFAGHLLSFALARELTAADQIALDAIETATADDDYRLKTLIKQIVLSAPFQNKTNPKHAN